VYQPKVDLASGACIGAEALLRWSHPTFGDVSPAEFIPIVEQTSMVRATTHWVVETALRQLAAWWEAGLELQVAVNVSAVNLLEPDFCGRIVDGPRRHGLPASSLALEITESVLMKNPRLAEATPQALDAAGVRLAIDDFGTGYSSLAYLQSLPAQVVKIDQSFVRGIERDERKRSLVSAMIKLSHDQGHRVVAEGGGDGGCRGRAETGGVRRSAGPPVRAAAGAAGVRAVGGEAGRRRGLTPSASTARLDQAASFAAASNPISSEPSSLSMSSRISMRSSTVPRPRRYSPDTVAPRSGAGLIWSGVRVTTSETLSTTMPIVWLLMFRTITTVNAS